MPHRGNTWACHMDIIQATVRCFIGRLYSLPDRYHSDMVPYRTKTMRLWRLLPLSLKLEISDSGLCLPYRYVTQLSQVCFAVFIGIWGCANRYECLIKLLLNY